MQEAHRGALGKAPGRGAGSRTGWKGKLTCPEVAGVWSSEAGPPFRFSHTEAGGLCPRRRVTWTIPNPREHLAVSSEQATRLPGR